MFVGKPGLKAANIAVINDCNETDKKVEKKFLRKEWSNELEVADLH